MARKPDESLTLVILSIFNEKEIDTSVLYLHTFCRRLDVNEVRERVARGCLPHRDRSTHRSKEPWSGYRLRESSEAFPPLWLDSQNGTKSLTQNSLNSEQIFRTLYRSP